MDIRRPPRRDPDGLGTILTEALDLLSQAGQGFGELVTSHLRMVVATDHVARHYILPSSAWGSTFEDQSRINARVLACKLVWAAAAIRLARDAKATGLPVNRAGISAACWDAQQRFLRQFPDADEWIEYMEPDQEGDDGPIAGAA